jgi:hypothetical protein
MKLLQEPLVHFLIAGALLFVGYTWLNHGEVDNTGKGARVVRITANEIEWLTHTWTRQWQRPPTADELKGLVADYLKEELLSREARTLQLDVEDTIVRRRLAQKMEFFIEDTARLATPSDEELRQFYEANHERFQPSTRITFRHVFFSRDHQGGAAAAAAHAQQQLLKLDASDEAAALGDRFLLEYEFTNADEQTIANLFGPDFARQVFALDPNQWRGPIASSYGLHLVRVSQRQASRTLDFAEVRDGDLSDAPAGKSPTFLVAALRDPIGANLDRIQIIKGWLDAKGEVHEKIYDVVWGDADKRQPGKDGKLPPVGNTVDVENAIWTNTIGAPELITVWKDPDFDAKQRAFYYARILEIPTPRWTAYDAKRFGVKPLPDTTMTLQERAYTSPIWYTPAQ